MLVPTLSVTDKQGQLLGYILVWIIVQIGFLASLQMGHDMQGSRFLNHMKHHCQSHWLKTAAEGTELG